VNFLFEARGIPKLTVYTWTFIRLGNPRPRLPTQHNTVKKKGSWDQTAVYDIV